jgi:hypothetical protein
MPKLLTAQTYTGDLLFEWSVVEYEQYERPKQWYIIVGIIASLLILFGIVTQNFLFTLIILLAGIIVYLQSIQPPLTVPVAVGERGIIVGRRFYGYDEFTEFYIVFVPEQTKTLYLETKSIMHPRVQLDIDDVDAVALRELLLRYLPENFEKEEEPASEQMRKMWRIH